MLCVNGHLLTPDNQIERAGRKARCRVCTNKSSLESRHRAKHYLDEFKSLPCTDCGGTYPTECMEFDHLPGTTKVAAVCKMVTFAREKLMAELAKCELVCANCHRIRTASRR